MSLAKNQQKSIDSDQVNPLTSKVNESIVHYPHGQQLTYSINRKGNNKQHPERLTSGWVQQTGDINQLFQAVKCGWAITGGLYPKPSTRRAKANVSGCQLILIDIDETLTLDEALTHAFIQQYGLGIYTSASHQKLKNGIKSDRFRLIFGFPEIVTDIDLYEAAVKELMAVFPEADQACKDASRIFYGNTEAKIFPLTGQFLPHHLLTQAQDRLTKERQQQTANAQKYLNQLNDLSQSDQERLCLAALEFIPYMAAGDGSYNTIFKPVAMGLKEVFGDDGAIAILEGISNKPNIRQKVKSLKVASLGALINVAKEYGFDVAEWYRGESKSHRFSSSPETLRLNNVTNVDQLIKWFHLNLDQQQQNKRPKLKFDVDNQQPIAKIQYNSHNLPDRDRYEDLPAPELIYPQGTDYNQLIKDLRAKGWVNVIDASVTGSGKSHNAATIDGNVIYIDKDHKNPSTEVIATKPDLMPRHNGLWLGDDGKYRRNGEGNPNIPSNCYQADLQVGLQSKNYTIDGDSNPICDACNLPCAFNRGAGHGFLLERKNTLQQPWFRTAIESLPGQDDFEYQIYTAIIEEATEQARNSIKRITGNHGDISSNFDRIEAKNPELYKLIKPLKLALIKLFDSKQPRYGFTKDDILNAVGTAPEQLLEVIDQIDQLLIPDIKLLEPDRVNGAGHSGKLVNNYFRKEAKNHNQGIIDNTAPNLLSPLLKIWVGLLPGNIRLTYGALTVTIVDDRKKANIQAFGFRLFLDATGDIETIANAWELDPHSILTIKKQTPALTNLTVFNTRMEGLKSRNRSNAALDRIAAYKDEKLTTNPNAKFIGYKGDDGIDGYWFRDERGTNQFKGIDDLTFIGLPFPHLGAIKDEFNALAMDGSFDDYYSRITRNSIIQAAGRQRVQHYPKQQFTLDFVGPDIDLSFLTNLLGCEVIDRNAGEITPEAGTKAELRSYQILNFLKSCKGHKLPTLTEVANYLDKSKSYISEVIKKFWNGWSQLIRAVRKAYISSKGNTNAKHSDLQGINPIYALVHLLEGFRSGGWAKLTAYLQEFTPEDQLFALGLLSNFASTV